MQLPKELSPEAEHALIEAIKIFARHGKQLREARERKQKETAEVADTSTADQSVAE